MSSKSTHPGVAAGVAPRLRPMIALGILSLGLAACGGDSPPGSAGTPGPAPVGEGPATPPASGGGEGGEAPQLDCARDGYPCSFADVPVGILERSLALSDEVADKLIDGMPLPEVETFLASQSDVAEVIVDGGVVWFRLAGGRPMIVDVDGKQELLPVPAPAAASAGAADAFFAGTMNLVADGRAGGGRRYVRMLTSGSRLSTGTGEERHALVLSPFRYEPGFGNAGELVADALAGVRGYSGNVTYLATTSEHQPQVTVDVLAQLDGYDVIHLDTHGGTICKDKDAAAGAKTDGKTCEDGITDFLVQRFHGTAQDLQSLSHPGVVHYRGRLHQSIAVTADFFRHHYPQGLANQLFVLGSCNTFRADMIDAVAGYQGMFASWDGYTDFTLVRDAGLALVDLLGKGLTVGESFERLPGLTPGNPEAQGQFRRSARKLGGDLRIRSLITVRDYLTGEEVTDTSGIEVIEVAGDGADDDLHLEFTIDGITEERLEDFFVNLEIEDQVIGHLDLKKVGVKVAEFSYRVTGPVPLPFDAQQGQTLDMHFWIPLPDLGEDIFRASPKVNERETVDAGSEWVLGSRYTAGHTDSSMVKTADLVFELEPGADLGKPYRIFRVRGGTVRIRYDFEDALGCRFDIDHTVDVATGANNMYLRFDRVGDDLYVEGFGALPSTYIKATGFCPNGPNVEQTVSVGGVFFMADPTLVSGKSFSGGYNDGASLPTVIEWTLDQTL